MPVAERRIEGWRELLSSRDFLADNACKVMTLEDAAMEAFLSPAHYHRLFVQSFSETPLEFVRRLRLDKAKRLLLRTDLSVAEICFEVGYQSVGNFCTLFKREIGCSPREFRIQSLRFYPAWKAPHRFIPSCIRGHLGGVIGS